MTLGMFDHVGIFPHPAPPRFFFLFHLYKLVFGWVDCDWGNIAKIEVVYLVSIILTCPPFCQRWCCTKVFEDPVFGVSDPFQLQRQPCELDQIG